VAPVLRTAQRQLRVMPMLLTVTTRVDAGLIEAGVESRQDCSAIGPAPAWHPRMNRVGHRVSRCRFARADLTFKIAFTKKTVQWPGRYCY
jgi:hypothetical protein